MFIIEDEAHSEHMGRFDTRAEAVAELRRLATVAWDQEPNCAPCTSWRTCGREYRLIECDTATTPWRQVSSTAALKVSAAEVSWLLAED